VQLVSNQTGFETNTHHRYGLPPGDFPQPPFPATPPYEGPPIIFEQQMTLTQICENPAIPLPPSSRPPYPTSLLFLIYDLPCKLYMLLLFRLPLLYSRRATSLLENAPLSNVEDILDNGHTEQPGEMELSSFSCINHTLGSPTHESEALDKFQFLWEAFLDTLLTEWRTLNIISGLIFRYKFA
jgi:hypothetical protein